MTTPERNRRASELFQAALDLESEDRGPFLERECRDDPELRDLVVSLLEADSSLGDFLVSPLDGQTQTGSREDPRPALVGERIGNYEILGKIGSGGMGTVYEALQESPRRRVALKVMKMGAASPQGLVRFHHEAEVLGRLDHPGIARIYEAGTEERLGGLPYFAMELVPGARSILRHAAQERLSIRQRLELFTRVCDAVHFGHQHGIIHRDLKPGNILVDRDGNPRVIDFGVARATDPDSTRMTRRTDVGQMVGTLRYMSPEQCSGDPVGIDIRCDVYALGLVLYELLSGRLPYEFPCSSPLDVVRTIKETEPHRLSAEDGSLKGDPETIVHKALEKEPPRRYQSVLALAEDIRRHLGGEVILARPAGVSIRAWKLLRRNPVTSVALGVTALAILAFLSFVLFWSYPQIRTERDRALEAGNQARLEAEKAEAVNEFLQEVLASASPRLQGRDTKVAEILALASEEIEESFAEEPEIRASLEDTIGWSFYRLGLLTEAEAHLRSAVELRGRALGPEDRETLRSRNRLAVILEKSGALEESESIQRSNLETYSRLLGAEHPATMVSMSNLGDLLSEQGRYEEAEKLIRRELEIRTRLHGEEAPETLISMNNLAVLLARRDRFDEAVPLMEQIAEIQVRLLGKEHPRALIFQSNVANAYTRVERYAEAETLNRRLLEIRRRVLGAEHPSTLISLNNLAGALYRQGRLEEAEPLLRDVLSLRRKVLGPEHPKTVAARDHLASLLRETGREEEAEGLNRAGADSVSSR